MSEVLLKKILRKVERHDGQIEKVLRVVERHDGQLEKVLKVVERHDEQLGKVLEVVERYDKRFDAIDKQLDVMAMTLVGHEERFESIQSNMATKQDIHEIMGTLDAQGVILQRLDQERVFTNERIKRVEAKVGI